MNMSNSGNGNWPVVPIFGRRKRPRQAFYASPSQDICKAESVVHKQSSSDCQMTSNNQFKCTVQNSTALLNDETSLDGFYCEDTLQNTCKDSFEDGNQSYSENGLKRNRINQTCQNIPLQKHPRNNFKAGKEFKFTKESEENTGPNSHRKQRKEPIGVRNPLKFDEKPRPQPTRSTVPRILTLTTGDIKEVLGYKDNIIFALYEVYGVLHSQVISTNGQCTKQFIIRDSSGTLQCIFWEIDRPLPYIRRGTLIRCVGRLLKESFQCLSIRTANHAEIDNAKTLQKQSREVIDSYFLTSREY